MKHVVIISPANLPIPALKGGAIETLATFLLQENEKQPHYRFTVYNQNVYPVPQEMKVGLRHVAIRELPYYGRYYRIKAIAVRALSKLFDKGCYYTDCYGERICKRLSNDRPDLVLLEGVQIYAPLIRRRLSGLPIILHVHTDILNPSATFAREIVESCDRILCVSTYIKSRVDSICDEASAKTVVVKNCVDVARFQFNESARKRIRTKYAVRDDETLLVFCGRIDATKGVDALSKAFLALHNTNVRLMIIGASWFSATERSDFEKELDEILWPVSDRVVFTGYVAHDDMPAYYSAADILAAPSVCNDAAPLVVLEAAACALPVITTKRGGIPEYVSKRSAILLSADDFLPMRLAFTIDELVKNPALLERIRGHAVAFAQNMNTRWYFENMSAAIDFVIG